MSVENKFLARNCKVKDCSFFAASQDGMCSKCSKIANVIKIRPDLVSKAKPGRKTIIPDPPKIDISSISIENTLDPQEIKFRRELKVGDRVDAFDSEKLWYSATILDIRPGWVFVTYDEWFGDNYDEWHVAAGPKIALLYTKSKSRLEYQYENIKLGARLPETEQVKVLKPTSYSMTLQVVNMITENPSDADDKSSMFLAISSACGQDRKNLAAAKQQRFQAYETVKSNVKEFKPWLGMSLQDYRVRVLSANIHGQEIDMVALSNWYKCQFVVFRNQDSIISVYGTSNLFKTRAFFVEKKENEYLYLEYQGRPENVQKRFLRSDSRALNLALHYMNRHVKRTYKLKFFQTETDDQLVRDFSEVQTETKVESKVENKKEKEKKTKFEIDTFYLERQDNSIGNNNLNMFSAKYKAQDVLLEHVDHDGKEIRQGIKSWSEIDHPNLFVPTGVHFDSDRDTWIISAMNSKTTLSSIFNGQGYISNAIEILSDIASSCMYLYSNQLSAHMIDMNTIFLVDSRPKMIWYNLGVDEDSNLILFKALVDCTRQRSFKPLPKLDNVFSFAQAYAELISFKEEKKIEPMPAEIVEKKEEIKTKTKDKIEIKDEAGLKDDVLCKICMEHRVTIVLIPCGHAQLCDKCSDKITDKCPTCKSVISKKMTFYM